MKKKVCMVVPSFSAKGGITSVVSGYRGSKLEDEYDIKYIETYCDGIKIKKIIKAFLSYVHFCILILFWKPSIVHIHSSFGGSFYRKSVIVHIASLFNVPIINHIHGSEIDKLYTFASPKKKRFIERTFEKCSLIIVLSEECRDKLEVINAKLDCRIINNYGEIRVSDIARKKNNIVLFLGFLTELKGCYDIPYVLKKVALAIPNVKFVLGGVGEIEKIQSLLEKLGVSSFVEFPGWVSGEAKKELLSNSKLFFLPSYTEAMPVSILEAMGYGLPVISTNVGGIPQLVYNNYNGFLLEPGDVDGMANAIITVLKNDKEAVRLGENSLEIIEKNYSLKQHIEKISFLYEQL